MSTQHRTSCRRRARLRDCERGVFCRTIYVRPLSLSHARGRRRAGVWPLAWCGRQLGRPRRLRGQHVRIRRSWVVNYESYCVFLGNRPRAVRRGSREIVHLAVRVYASFRLMYKSCCAIRRTACLVTPPAHATPHGRGLVAGAPVMSDDSAQWVIGCRKGGAANARTG